MNPRKTADIRQALERKGFAPANRDHLFLFLHVAGKKSRFHTKLSHGQKEYGTGLLSLMANQLGLSNPELGELLDCHMSGEDYLALLRSRGAITD